MDKPLKRLLHISGALAALTPIFVGIFFAVGSQEIHSYYNTLKAPLVPVDFYTIIEHGSIPFSIILVIIGIIATSFVALNSTTVKKDHHNKYGVKIQKRLQEFWKKRQHPKTSIAGVSVLLLVGLVYILMLAASDVGQKSANRFLRQSCPDSILCMVDGSPRVGCLFKDSDSTYWLKPTKDGKPVEDVTYAVPKSTVKLIVQGEGPESCNAGRAVRQSVK